MKILPKYSIGVGDRFGRQARAQLAACQKALAQGVEVIPVWNKSHREHTIIGSVPQSVRDAADRAVRETGWSLAHFVDADHIGLATVDAFLSPCDFFTIDVAHCIGQRPDPAARDAFVRRHANLAGQFGLRADDLPRIADQYLAAVAEAGRIYRRLAAAKGEGNFVTEVSMDETDRAQTPPELLAILAALSDEGIPLQTIAPKFTGRFNKGVDYVGDVAVFAREFADDLAVLALARETFGLPQSLKLSVHSGSDKFSLYGPMREALQKADAGVHLKTAGTTWLEEVIGLAEAGGEGLALAREIYAHAFEKRDALCGPYAAVIDIDPARLPAPAAVDAWSSAEFVAALRHEPDAPAFNPHVRQLLHVGYKIAAEAGERYLSMLDACESAVARNVTDNLYERHLKPLFC